MAVQKYRFGKMVVEVEKVVEVSEQKRKFRCLVRGWGHNNPTPRREYTIVAETNAKAARIAIDSYNKGE